MRSAKWNGFIRFAKTHDINGTDKSVPYKGILT